MQILSKIHRCAISKQTSTLSRIVSIIIRNNTHLIGNIATTANQYLNMSYRPFRYSLEKWNRRQHVEPAKLRRHTSQQKSRILTRTRAYIFLKDKSH